MEEIGNNDKALKDLQKKGLGKFSKDKVIILSIIIGVLAIAGAIFGVFYYNNNVVAIATFDGGKVTKAEYAVYYKLFASMLTYYGYPESQIPSQIANKAGVDKIILKKAEAAGVKITDENKAKVDEVFSDKEQVQSFVDKGIDIGKMKELYYNDYIINQYIEKLKSEASNDDMLAYIKELYGDTADLNEYVTRQILFSTSDSSTGSAMTDAQKAEVKAKAEQILAKVLAGEDFAKLASENSDDKNTKANGGEYKMYMDSNTVEPYVNAVKTLQVGQTYATLVESDYGYHIIKLEAINPNGRTNSDSERENYVSKLMDQYGTDLHLKVNDSVLKKTTEKITGKSIDDTSDSTTTNGTSGTTDGSSDGSDSSTDTTNQTSDTTTQQ